MNYSSNDKIHSLFLLLASEQRETQIVETKVREFFGASGSLDASKEVAVDLLKVSRMPAINISMSTQSKNQDPFVSCFLFSNPTTPKH